MSNTNVIWQFLASLLGVMAAYTVLKLNGNLSWWIKLLIGAFVAALTGVLVAITQAVLQNMGFSV